MANTVLTNHDLKTLAIAFQCFETTPKVLYSPCHVATMLS